MWALLSQTANVIELIARGGGGGSGGGGGGGGAGIILIGYAPTHLWGAFLRRKMPVASLAFLLMVIGTLAWAALGFIIGSWLIISGVAALVGGPAGYFGWFGKVSRSVRKATMKRIQVAASEDPAWNEAALVARVEEVFNRFQADWSASDPSGLRSYMTEAYATKNALILAALRQRQRQNLVENPIIIDCFPIAMNDAANNANDQVTFLMHAKAHDVLLETGQGANQQLYVDNKDFTEYWQFAREDNTWLLNDISQQTADASSARPDIMAFAAAHAMYYSLDWGWLLLPRRGQLFQSGHFGVSDINNHVIGLYNNLLVEMYTYISHPESSRADRDEYVIAQVAIPKYYDSIIVAAKETGLRGRFQRAPRGYNTLKLEWPDFNQRYVVYATNVEQVTAFELLHPVYMEKLFALPFKVSIEVVDNVIYFYTRDLKADYAAMYELLQAAYQELKL